ncbi:MAG: molybdenum cofactor guanylyltransferase [Nitrospiraceae bacterium]|nr:molybdenum cofactor guanylyltransferase [Nitrospiraceae bacterium]
MLAVVLAGGENRRLPITKGFVKIGGRRIIEGLLAALGGFFDRLAISTNEPEKYYYLGVPLVGDVYPVRGPMTGIFSALSFFSGNGKLSAGDNQASPGGDDDAFFIACDMPYVKTELAARLASMRRGHGWHVIAPVWKGRPEPLFAFYSSRCLPSMETRLLAGKTALREFMADARTLFLDEEETGGIDPAGLSFININTAGDLKAALALAPGTRTPAPLNKRIRDMEKEV